MFDDTRTTEAPLGLVGLSDHAPLHPDECDCSCHTTGAIHVMACCIPCPGCKKNIRTGAYEEHAKACRIPVEFEQDMRRG